MNPENPNEEVTHSATNEIVDKEKVYPQDTTEQTVEEYNAKKQKPTIAELQAILEGGERKISIEPDGSIKDNGPIEPAVTPPPPNDNIKVVHVPMADKVCEGNYTEVEKIREALQIDVPEVKELTDEQKKEEAKPMPDNNVDLQPEVKISVELTPVNLNNPCYLEIKNTIDTFNLTNKTELKMSGNIISNVTDFNDSLRLLRELKEWYPTLLVNETAEGDYELIFKE